MLQVELRLPGGIEPGHQIVQTGTPSDDHQFLDLDLHFRSELRSDPGSSGVTLSWPILPAFSASSRKARPNMTFGSLPPALSAIRVRQSMERTGSRVALRA